MNIRLAQFHDVPALADLIRDIGYFSWVNDLSEEDVQSHIRAHLAMCLEDDSHTVYVACADNDQDLVVGYVSIHWLPYLISKSPEGYVSELFIRPAARGQGVGSALLDTATAEARRRGCGRMRLLNMRHRESYMRGFYKKHGWEEREDAATFQLDL